MHTAGDEKSEVSDRRAAILDATEALLIETGYGAVSTRKVAQRAGLTAPLLHYYFKTTDDLMIAVYRRAADRAHGFQAKALEERGLVGLWEAVSDGKRMALAIEFMAMANHRPAIKDEIARAMKPLRAKQREAVEAALAKGATNDLPFSPLALTVIAAGIGQALVMETGVGLELGHDETRAQIKAFIERYLPHRPENPPANSDR